jgi:hypothetical protein
VLSTTTTGAELVIHCAVAVVATATATAIATAIYHIMAAEE